MNKRMFHTAFFLTMSLSTLVYGAPMKHVDVKLNPNPRMRYEITMTIDHAPGPFERIEGSVDYKVTNEHCVPMTGFEGVTIAPEKRLPVDFRKVGDNVYKGDVLVDALQDEDYYGMGVCHWTLVGAGASLSANKTDVSPSIFLKDILAGHAVVRFFAEKFYHNTEMPFIDNGEPDASRFKDPGKTYSITLQARESIK
jgi:hypothetical protein